MKTFADWISGIALSLGAPGLFVIAFLDSSFLSLPEINDLLLVWMVTQHKSRMALYAGAATLGSLVGCLTLYYLGRKGGEAFVHKRFGSGRANRAIATFQRYGVLAVLIPSLLPPPAPFKIFVLMAGVAGIGAGRFALAIGIGRGIRYFGEGYLAVLYGDQAIAFIHEHGRTVSYVLVGLLVTGLLAYIAWRRVKGARQPVTGG
jgi:membrane protein YqaA with SNARE-associated domain